MIGRRAKVETGRKAAPKKRKWEEEDDDGGGSEPEITEKELEQWRKKEKEEEAREERQRKRREKEEQERKREEEKRAERAERRRREEEEERRRTEDESAKAAVREPEKAACVPVPIIADSAFRAGPVDQFGARRAVCMAHLQHKQRGAPACAKGDACSDRHTDDISELVHWTTYFGMRHCKFGSTCRLLQFCLYRHPPGTAEQQRLLLRQLNKQTPSEMERVEAGAAAEVPVTAPVPVPGGVPQSEKRGACMLHLHYKCTGAPPCPNGDDCPQKHPDEPEEIAHWVKYFGERMCKFGANCKQSPHCLYWHPNVAQDSSGFGSAAASAAVAPPPPPPPAVPAVWSGATAGVPNVPPSAMPGSSAGVPMVPPGAMPQGGGAAGGAGAEMHGLPVNNAAANADPADIRYWAEYFSQMPDWQPP